MVSQMWCVRISGQHVVVLTHSPLEQFARFKAEHADCDVSKASAAGTSARAVSVGVHVSLWQQPHVRMFSDTHCILSRAEANGGFVFVELALVVIGCTFANSSLLPTPNLLTA